MRWKNLLGWAGLLGAFALLIIVIFTEFHASHSFSTTNDEEHSSGDVTLTNNVENNIEAETADVTNNIENTIEHSENVKLENNVTNNIDVAIDVHLENAVDNNITSTEDDTETNQEDNGNGNENDSDDDAGSGNGDGNENDSESGNGNDNGNEGDEESSNDNGNGSNEDGTNDSDATEGHVWGVDSASVTDEEMLACVQENFGDPEVWGRYLGDKDGVSYGLTEDEVALLHDQDIDILVIWNHFEDATGYEKGYAEAERAIQDARDFDIPEGVALFANVEPIYPIDSGFLLGWYDAIEESEYEAGVYGIFDPDEELHIAFEAAAEENESLLEEMYVWTASPHVGITTKTNAPAYNPDFPEKSTVIGWQYGIDAETCNIDTNWYDGEHVDVLW